jgi:hypothetical protein
MEFVHRPREKIKAYVTESPHPMLLALGIGIGVSALALLIMSTLDGSLLGEAQKVSAVRKFEEW